MSPELTLILVVTLAVLLAISSAVAGAFWFRLRSIPLYRAAQLARELADRQRALEDLIARLEARAQAPGQQQTARPFLPGGPANLPQQASAGTIRVDSPASPRTPAAPGMTLIAVPDLSAPPPSNPPAASEFAQRYGSIWKLAEEGVTPEAIARLTGQSVGQVELILGLRRQAASSSSSSALARP